MLDCLASADAAHAEQRSKHEASAKAEWEQEREATAAALLEQRARVRAETLEALNDAPCGN